MTALLSLQDATYEWRGRALVNQVSLDVEAGALTVVIGPNGAGKSTLLRLLSGDLRPTRGAALGLGERLDRIAPWRLAGLRAVMTQAVEVAFPFTGIEVVDLGLGAVGRALQRSSRTQVVERCLAAADALDFARQSYDKLSGGEKRRIHFARALAQLEAGRTISPRQALLLDEPIASLDLRHQLTLLDEARRLASQGVAVLAVLHDFNLAVRYADTLAVMNGGSLTASGSKREVLTGSLLSSAFGLGLTVSSCVSAKEPLVLPSAWIETRQAATDWAYAASASREPPRYSADQRKPGSAK